MTSSGANIKAGTPLGTRVKAITDAGDLVPDALTNDIVADRLAQPDAANGFLLDGYPRTEAQVAFLDETLAAEGEALDAVIRLVADEDEVVRRLVLRGIELGRSDDTEGDDPLPPAGVHARDRAARRALRAAGSHLEVDGLGPVDEVTGRILDALADRGFVPPRD